MFVNELFTEAEARQLVVFYPGRFQPFHLGHRDVFASLQGKFGRDSVFIATSNKTELPKSPFNFSEKVAFMNAAGVHTDRILQITNPYKLPEQFDDSNTVFVVAVGEPDANRLKPDSLKKDGSPAYFKTFKSIEDCETADKHGYVIIAEERHMDITLKGQTVDVSHGTPSRAAWNMVRNDPEGRAEYLKQMFGRNDPELGRILDKIPVNEDSNMPVAKDSGSAIPGISVLETIRKVAGGYRLVSKKDKNLGTYPSKSGAEKRERQVQYFKHVGESATVTRIDSKPIGDFASDLKAYKHTDDWSQSGIDTGDDSYWKSKNLKTNTTKGLFAGDPHRTALYATGNAHETRYVEFTQNGQPIVYFDKKDLPKIRSRKTYISVFDAGNFKKLPTGEYFSSNPGQPLEQKPISDPFQYIADQGWVVRITDDLNKVFKQVRALHKAGKISHYGAEGMTESAGQSVAEDAAGVGVVKNSKDPRYVMATAGDQNDVTAATLPKEMKAYGLIGRKNPTAKKQ